MNTFNEEIRAYTEEEIKIILLENMFNIINTLSKHKHQDGMDLAYYFISTLERGTPPFEINASTDGEDIAGNLHYYVLQNQENIQQLLRDKEITYTQLYFINRIQELANDYNYNQINNPHHLIAQLFSLIDDGIENIKFELKSLGNEEDIEEAIQDEENYYPLESKNIAGDLAKMYTNIVKKYNMDYNSNMKL